MRLRLPLGALTLALLVCLAAGCRLTPEAGEIGTEPATGSGAPSEAVAVDPPAAPGALAPNLANVRGSLAATWLEPTQVRGSKGHRLQFSKLQSGVWTDPVTVAEGSDFFANWADLPALIEAGDKTLYAHWLAKTASDTYAYSIFLARSRDRGKNWEPLGKLNSDSTPTEHGFVSLVPEGNGARAFWLDGRGMIEAGPMTLRTAQVGVDQDPAVGRDEVLDERVCECCSTDAALGSAGPMVVYRDRSADEVRDIGIVRSTGQEWTEPTLVAEDSWTIAGCPVNGPELDAKGDRAVVVWFTSSHDTARVQVAFSGNAGVGFDPPLVVDSGSVLGRADVALDNSEGAWVSWVTQVGDEAEIRLQHMSPEGPLVPARLVAKTSPGRASGFPILERIGDRLYLAFVEVGDETSASRIRVRAL